MARASLFLVVALVAACASPTPRERLGRLGVPYSAEMFVAQAGEGDGEVVELFLDSGMPPNVRNKEGITAITNAAAAGYANVVNLLIAKGAAVEPHNAPGLTPLTAASWAGHTDVVEALLAHGADPNAVDG